MDKENNGNGLGATWILKVNQLTKYHITIACSRTKLPRFACKFAADARRYVSLQELKI